MCKYGKKKERKERIFDEVANSIGDVNKSSKDCTWSAVPDALLGVIQ